MITIIYTLRFSSLKYILAYIIPVLGFVAVSYQGILSWSVAIFAFGIIPILELVIGGSDHNLSANEEKILKANKFFDILLYINLPITYMLVFYYLTTMTTQSMGTADIIGTTFSIGIVLGSMINVAHELGHKRSKIAQFTAKALLLPNHYLHFIIEHNRGHHVNVGTPKDPATSRKGENLFAFWMRSIIYSYLSAWSLEKKRLQRGEQPIISLKNEMIKFSIFHILYFAIIFTFFGMSGLLYSIYIGVIGILLLETINYIEHYGLTRKMLPNGKYERVEVFHSWNSNHEIGRIVLYELTRHSDHHYLANRKYQILRHHDESPQLPYGYPTSMLIALIPPLWFSLMNGQLEKVKK